MELKKNLIHKLGGYFDAKGISPTLDSCGGGNRMPKILIPSTRHRGGERKIKYALSNVSPTILATQYKSGDQQPKVAIPITMNRHAIKGFTDISHRLMARDYKGIGNQEMTAVAVLTPDRANKRQNGRRIKDDNEPMFTLTAQDRHGVLIRQRPRGNNKGGLHEVSPTITSNDWQNNNHLMYGSIIRRLTPRECWRLQGFPDELFDKARAVNSDSQLYKQAGNSVTVNVVYEIAKKLKESEE